MKKIIRKLIVGMSVLVVGYIGYRCVVDIWTTPTPHKVETVRVEKKEQEMPTVSSTLGWELTLVNKENPLPPSYTCPLEEIDTDRSFDSRAIRYLETMMVDARKQGVGELWAQSTYRSVQDQRMVFNEKVSAYIAQGKTQEEAETLTEQTINRPGQSEHNLGLAVDFNYVNTAFSQTKAFTWLQQHAEEYGFILRYPPDKEAITKVQYEPWHWRYVGKEHAQKMNALQMCLEEYVAYVQAGEEKNENHIDCRR